MKNKRVLIFAVLFLGVGIYLYFKYVHGWLEFRKNTDTPERFLSHTLIDKKKYANDSIEILRGLEEQMSRHEGFFYSQAYFDSTSIIINTILYNPSFDKLAVLFITKNPTYRQEIPENYKWYYDATCYLGVRKNDSIVLSWIGPVFTNSPDEQEITNNLRTACFRTFVTKDTTDAYSYNINDIRFWTSPIWKKIEDEKLRKAMFDEEKKEHPENVYEPR